MEDFLLRLLEMSLAGSITAAVVMLARLVMKRAPKAVVCALWAVVLFRLLCPFTIESAVGLFPAKEQPVEPRQVIYASPFSKDEPDYSNPAYVIPDPDAYTAPVVPVTDHADAEPVQRMDWVHIGWAAGFAVWIIGAAAMTLHGTISLIKLKKRLRNAERYDENVFIAKGLETAFVLGVFKPGIYLPDGLNEREQSYILMHEHTHVRRGDHIFKLIGYCALCLHWFNPVAWLAFTLAGRDLEMACDEAVIRRLGANVKKEYSASLLALATGKHIVSGMPLAFGEGDTKGRVKNVLKYKKPALWAAVIAVVIVAALCVGLACNQPKKTAMVRVGYEVYEWNGDVINAVPESSTKLGVMDSILHNHNGKPEKDMQGVNLDEKYAGCTLYGDGGSVLYIEAADGSALVLRLAETQEAPVMELGEEEMQALLGTDEPIDVFHIVQMQGSRAIVGYYIGNNSDIGAACITREGKDGEYVLHSSGRIGEIGNYEGTALVSLGIPEKSWYEVLIVTDPDIAQAICRNDDGYTTITMQDVPSVYVVDDEQTGTWEFYDQNGSLMEIKPSIMATETDSVAVEIVKPDEADDRINALEFISNGEVMYLASLQKDTVMGDYLDKLVRTSLMKSAAWPAEDVLPDDYFVLTSGDAVSGATQYYIYEFPELGSAVIQMRDMCTMISDEDWEMLLRIVAADEKPYIYVVAQCYGTQEMNRMVLGSKELRERAEEIWNWKYLSSSIVPRAVLSDIGPSIKLTQVALDGTETSAYLFQRENTTIMQSGDQAAVSVPEENYTFFSELFPKTPVLSSDVDGDQKEDLIWWSETNQDTYGVTLYVSRTNGHIESFPVSAMYGESLMAADVTGDGLDEVIAMADTGGNGGMGCHALTILSYRDGAMRELPIPFFEEIDDNEPDWSVSGYRFGTKFEDGCKLHVKGDLFDEVIDFRMDSYQVQDRILMGQFDDFHKVKYTMSLEESGCDGIFRVDTVTYDRSPGYELQLYQYLWQQGHSDGVGFGVTTIHWDEEAQEFIPVEQGWTREPGTYYPQLKGMDMNGDGAQDYACIHHYASTPTLEIYFLGNETVEKQLTDENWTVQDYADITGDGKDEIILRASPRGNAVADLWCILTYKNGELMELELPNQGEFYGYEFFLEYKQPYLSFRIYSEKLDTTVEFTDEQKKELSNDATRYESQIYNDFSNNWIGTDGITDIHVVQLDNGKYALDISQYLYSGAHMNGGIGDGYSRIVWNGQEFEVIDQWFLSRWHDDKRFPE